MSEKRLQDELDLRGRQLAALAEFGARAAAALDSDALAEEAATLVLGALAVDACEIVEHLPGRDAVRWRARSGTLGGADGGGGHSVAVHALRAGEELVVPDLGGDPRFAGAGPGAAAAVLVPGPAGPCAALAVYCAAPRRFADADQHFLRSVANQLGVAAVRRRAEERAAVVLEVAEDTAGTPALQDLLARVHWRLAAAVPCDGVATFAWDGQRRMLRLVGHHGLPEAATAGGPLGFFPSVALEGHLARGETVVANDAALPGWLPAELLGQFGITASVLTPLKAPGRDFGVLFALKAGGKLFDEAQVQLCEAVARQLGVAMGLLELYHAREEEALISGGLAHVGQELISSLETPALLDRLAELTTQVLGCDCSYTFLLRADEGLYVPVSGYGDSVEQRAAVHAVRLPRPALGALESELHAEGVAQVGTGDTVDPLRGTGFTLVLYMALRVGSDLFGLQIAAYRGRQQAFTSQQLRMAKGIAQLASTALEYARVIEELERVSQLKSDFVATMSHELRTPLHVIIGYNDLLMERAFGDLTEEQMEGVQHVSERARELLALVTATLELTRLEGSGVLEPVHLEELLRDLAADFQPPDGASSVRFDWHVAPDLPALRSDRAKLKVILEELVANAFKCTDRGRVTVEVTPREGGVEIAVTDTGIGIHPDAVPGIFEPFGGGERAGTTGVHLGLYKVRRVLDMLGGTIAVRSEPGMGATFYVWVPPARPRRRRESCL